MCVVVCDLCLQPASQRSNPSITPPNRIHRSRYAASDPAVVTELLESTAFEKFVDSISKVGRPSSSPGPLFLTKSYKSVSAPLCVYP
jgi:hypothetical protein